MLMNYTSSCTIFDELKLMIYEMMEKYSYLSEMSWAISLSFIF